MREDSLRKKQTGMSDSIGPESGLRQTVLRRFHLGTMILLPSHRHNYEDYLASPVTKSENKTSEASQEELRQAADLLGGLLKF